MTAIRSVSYCWGRPAVCALVGLLLSGSSLAQPTSEQWANWQARAEVYIRDHSYLDLQKLAQEIAPVAPRAALIYEGIRTFGMNLQEQSIDVYERLSTIEPTNPTFWTRLGQLYLKDWRYQEATEVLRKAVELDPSQWFRWAFLADSLMGQRQYDEAGKAFQRAAELGGPEAIYLRSAANAFAAAGKQNSFRDVVRMLEQVNPAIAVVFARNLPIVKYEPSKSRHPPPEPEASLARKLQANDDEFRDAVLLFEAEKLDRSLPRFSEVFAERQKLLGGGHAQTVEAARYLAVNHFLLRSYYDAMSIYFSEKRTDLRSLFRDVVTRRQHALGADHPMTLQARVGLAVSEIEWDQFGEGLHTIELAVFQIQQLLGRRHVDLFFAYVMMASTYSRLGRAKEAQPLAEMALEIALKAFGPDSPNTGLGYFYLAATRRRVNASANVTTELNEAQRIFDSLTGRESFGAIANFASQLSPSSTSAERFAVTSKALDKALKES